MSSLRVLVFVLFTTFVSGLSIATRLRHRPRMLNVPRARGNDGSFFFHMLGNDQSAAELSYEDFMPDCLAHLEGLVSDLDRDYTDAMIETVLVNQCITAKEFNSPGVVETSFETHKSCTDFAKKLHNARDHDLRTGGSPEKYEQFCESFFVHKGGEVGCVAGCRSPNCAGGDKKKGGKPIELLSGICPGRCSELWETPWESQGKTRFCGTGEDYQGQASLDCERLCAKEIQEAGRKKAAAAKSGAAAKSPNHWQTFLLLGAISSFAFAA